MQIDTTKSHVIAVSSAEMGLLVTALTFAVKYASEEGYSTDTVNRLEEMQENFSHAHEN